MTRISYENKKSHAKGWVVAYINPGVHRPGDVLMNATFLRKTDKVTWVFGVAGKGEVALKWDGKYFKFDLKATSPELRAVIEPLATRYGFVV